MHSLNCNLRIVCYQERAAAGWAAEHPGEEGRPAQVRPVHAIS